MIEKIEKIKSFTDKRGNLLPIEFKTVGFDAKRVFIVNDVPVGDIRGNHSHHTTKQFLICVRGSVNVILDDGSAKLTVKLGRHEAVMIPELVWDAQEFLSEDAEILVICSTGFDLDDYILDYDEFLKVVGDVK